MKKPRTTNPKSEKNIRRIDAPGRSGHGGTHGFQVCFKRKGVEFTKQFSDSKYGGEQGALMAAREFRDRAVLALPPVTHAKGNMPPENSRNKANKSGHIGIHFRERKLSGRRISLYVCAVASPQPLKQLKKEFKVGERALKDVVDEAIAWRNGILETRKHKEARDKEAWDRELSKLISKRHDSIQKVNRLKVFLCHSKDDKDQVRAIYKRLLALGCDPWLDDESLLPGQDWDTEIRKAIRSAHVFLACLSNGSVTKRGYVQKEIRFALDVAEQIPDEDIFIIPIKLEPCVPPEPLSKWHWLEAYKDGYGKLIKSLAKQSAKLNLEPLQVNAS